MSTPDEQQLRRLVVQRLQSLRDAGVLDLPRVAPFYQAAPPEAPPESQQDAGAGLSPLAKPAPSQDENLSRSTQAANLAKKEAVPSRRPAAASSDTVDSGSPDVTPIGPPLPKEKRVAALTQLCQEVAACKRCQELSTTRTQTVFGVGDPAARLVFLGEAPGADEDRQGEPFVGRAGQLLTKIIEACSLRREDVYILNILKCRPPGNRNPSPEEAGNCRDHLMQQLQIIRPEFICCLGAVAAQNLLNTTTPIGQLRGRFHPLGDMRVVATYHPAYLLRNPNAKRATWEDMKLLMREMGIEIPNQ